ncbi:MAG: cell division protein ZapA [Clostridia bacterium]|nr:cell division protein ZapA [Clostridia bacterium]
MEKKKITVTVNKKNYTLLHDENDEYINKVVHYLNSKIASASTNGIQLGEQTATVMAGIAVTDELFKAQQSFNSLTNDTTRMMEEYDRLKADYQDLQEQFTALLRQNEELKKRVHILEHR